jgi:hypothetical protein
MWNAFWSDFKQGLREGPTVFFLPLIALWRLLFREARTVIEEVEGRT